MSKFKIGDKVKASESLVGTIDYEYSTGGFRVNFLNGLYSFYTEEELELVLEENNTQGRKDDSQKPDMTDIPLEAMWQMGQAFTYGQKKYAKNNFRNGMKVSRQLAAAVRHIYQHLDGQDLDPESNYSHLGHAMASLAMAIYNLKNNPSMDDRFEKDIERNKTGSSNG